MSTKSLNSWRGNEMTDKDLKTRIKFIVDRLSFKIGDLTLMYEHKQVDPEDFYKEVKHAKNDSEKYHEAD